MTRLELHNKLLASIENGNVYYQPPSNLSMKYPCIRYVKSDIFVKYANDSNYTQNTSYELTVISKDPDHEVINKLLKLQYVSYDRHYISDGLHHDVLTITC